MTSTEQTTRQILVSEIQAIRELPEDYTVNQSVSLDISAGGGLELSTQHPDVNGVSMAIWNGLVRSVGLPSGVVPEAVAEWLDNSLDELETIVDGMDERWDGSSHVGTLTEAAADQLNAWSDISDNVSGPWSYEAGQIIGVWEASDWLDAVSGDLAACESADAAVAMALELSGNGDVMSGPDGAERIYISAQDAESFAREVWEQAQPEADE